MSKEWTCRYCDGIYADRESFEVHQVNAHPAAVINATLDRIASALEGLERREGFPN